MSECGAKQFIFNSYRHQVHNFDRVEDDVRKEKFGYLHT